MGIEKKFIIFFIILSFGKQLNTITITPMASYNSVTGSNGYMCPTSRLSLLVWEPSNNNIMFEGIWEYFIMNFSGSLLSTPFDWQGGGCDTCVTYNPKETYYAAGFSTDDFYLAAIYNNNTVKIYSVSITPYSNGSFAKATLTLLGSESTLPSTATALSWNQISNAIVETVSSINNASYHGNMEVIRYMLN